MHRYQRVEKHRHRPESPINKNEIRITTKGPIRNYINYATSLFQEKRVREIVLKAMGQAISKTVEIAEIIKNMIPGLHQDTTISSISITDVWEPIEEGLIPLETIRHVSMISISLSTRELNKHSPGYQAPSFVEQRKPQNQYQQQHRQQHQRQYQPKQAPGPVAEETREEDLGTTTQHQDINEDDLKCRELEEDDIDEQVAGHGRGSFRAKTTKVGIDDSSNSATETRTGFSSSNIERQASDGGTVFTSSSDEVSKSNFMFSASPYAKGPSAASKYHYRRKNTMKVGQESHNSTPKEKVHLASPSAKFFPRGGCSLQPDPMEGLQGDPFLSQSEENRSEVNKKPEIVQEPISAPAASVAVEEECEKWRLRGNKAYANGNLSKAEEYYTCGVNCACPNETSRSCTRALMLCYSNRAATRMSLGRMREALSDCIMASGIDPSFLRARVRAANCHLALGEFEDASKLFKKCLQSGYDVNLDPKILLEASEGLQKAQSASAAVEEECEKWRLRGNQAYANGNLSKAEEYYTNGVNCACPNETSRCCTRALMLCYSNRAAPRMSLGRMREALSDCMMAAAIDPSFHRAQVRAANCHLALGEFEDASKLFKKCLQSGNDVSLDPKILSKASDGLKKAQKVADYMHRSAELLRKGTSDDARNALQVISEALSICPHSENFTEMKAEALLMLRSYEEVVQLCERTLDSAEKNIISDSADDELKGVDSSESMQNSPAWLWRWRLISKSYFYLGRLEEALDLLQKHEFGNKSSESPASFSATVHELLRLKGAGNEAFQAGRHSEAVEHYSAALARSIESRPFAAVCFCNRAAAYQALGQITDAIADCSLAIALYVNYAKAISRRATLHEMIRDYGQATDDLHRLISLFEKQADDKNSQSGALERSISSGKDLEQARRRLATVEEEARKGIRLDMYLILGIESSSTAGDIKKAYRKAALRHHPDKAGQFLSRSENGDDGLRKEVADEVYRDADRLFKMIGEAYTVLSDPTKRLQYDARKR